MTTIRRTSIETYRRIEAEGLLTQMRWRVYRALYHHGPLTRAEIVKHLEYPGMERQPDIYNRLSDLRVRKAAWVVGTRTCTVTGNRCQLWDVTDQLPNELATTQKEKTMTTKMTLTIEGGIEELGKVLDALRGTGVVIQTAAQKPTQPKGTAAADKKKTAVEKKAAAANGKTPPKPEAPAAPAEPEAPAAEPEPEAEAAPAESVEDGEVNPTHPELQDARRLREVVTHIMGLGIAERADVIKTCEGIKDDVPLLTRVSDIAGRVGKAFDMIA